MAKVKELTKEELSILFRKNAELTRIERGVSQEKFAESIDMSCSMYKRLITGQRQVDAAYALLRLCAIYDVHVFDLFELEDEVYRVASKYNRLDEEQRRHVEYIIDRELKNEGVK